MRHHPQLMGVGRERKTKNLEGCPVTSVCFRAPLLVAVLAVACKRSPLPPSPASSAAGSARSALSGSPPASASVAPVAPAAPPRCADWTVNDRAAKGSLEHFCQQFGPCPRSLQQAVDRMPRFSTTIETRGNYRVLRSGFLGGRRYTFEHDRLVGAQIWDDVAYGACAERQVSMYTAGLELPSSEPGTSCGLVPGRDYQSGEPCRCNLVVQTQPTLANGNEGPRLRTSLPCLYEIGVAAYLCQPTLQEQRELVSSREKDAKGHAEIAAGMRRARGTATASAAEKISLEQSRFRSSERSECGDTVVTWPFQGANAVCRYDARGSLTGLRWGKRYESDGIAACKR
jgi:hypothetical protein